jgi:ABC-2 type transport system permease protein
MYVKRCLKDSFTIGYSIIFPLIMIGLLGWIRNGSFSNGLTSFQYYTITMLPFIICCEIITAAYQGQEEGRLKVGERFLIAPITTKTLIMSKWCAGVTALSICHGFVYIVVKLVFRVSYEGKGLFIYLISIGLTALIYALGLLIGLGMKNFIMITNLLNIPIFIFAILGGCFFPFGSSDSLVAVLIKLSPLTWINRATFLAMYDRQGELMILLSGVLSLGVVIILIQAVKRFKKVGFLNGESLSITK